ncbi:MAG: hypothetical protein AABX03_02770 [Nanoarchaeota archaeon]
MVEITGEDISSMIERVSFDIENDSKKTLAYGRELLFDIVKYANDYQEIGNQRN